MTRQEQLKAARERAQRIRDARLDEARLAELERRAGCMDADMSEDEVVNTTQRIWVSD